MTDKASPHEVSVAIYRILDVAEKQVWERAPDKAREMYALILQKLKNYNERLWFSTYL